MPIVTAAGVGMALISSEHFFSTFLSSPWTVEKFAESEEDKTKVRRYYMIACIVSLIVAFVLAKIIKQPWPVVATLLVCLLYVGVYEKALRGGI